MDFIALILFDFNLDELNIFSIF